MNDFAGHMEGWDSKVPPVHGPSCALTRCGQLYDWHLVDGLLSASSADRNAHVVLEAFAAAVLTPLNAVHVLEVGSGTGQHVALLARDHPRTTFHPTELSEGGRAAIVARTATLPNVRPPYALDLLDELAPLPAHGVDAVIACNLLHVAPEGAIGGLARVAHRCGARRVAVYGAFSRHGAHTAESNAAFDAKLRNADPTYGVRDVDQQMVPVFAQYGYCLERVLPMPRDNMVVVFEGELRIE